jgi:hypothetical protein
MLFLDATTRREFHAAVSDLAQAILTAGGWVVSHQFYSTARAVIGCEIPGPALPAFACSLASLGVSLAVPAGGWPATGREVRAQIALTFGSEGGDVRRDVPAFG